MYGYFLDNIPSFVRTEDNKDLLKPLSKKEVLDVIWAMESDKSLGLDEFFFHFYRACWNIIKPRPDPHGVSLP